MATKKPRRQKPQPDAAESEESELRRYGRLCERMEALESDSKRLHAKVGRLERRLALAEAKVGLR